MAIWKIKERNELVRANDVKGTRGLFSGGNDPSGNVRYIDMIILETQGSAVDFGDITNDVNQVGGGNAGSSTRAFVRFGGEGGGSNYGTQSEVVNIKGGTGVIAADFGDLSVGRSNPSCLSSHVRAVAAGGQVAPAGGASNVIDYFTISSFGNASDFGDLTVARGAIDGLASPTRGIFAGGFVGPNTMKNEIDFITIASTGNASDFGDLPTNLRFKATGSNQTRGIIAGGQVPGNTTAMSHITIATTGNAVDFGDLTEARQSQGVSNQVHMFAGGGSTTNTIDKISFTNLGNSIDFGDLTRTFNVHVGASDGHGGLNDSNYIGIQRSSVTYMPGSGRGFFAGYHNPGHNVSIDLIHIPTLGNSSDFGDLSEARGRAGAAASKTRLVIGGGEKSPGVTTNVIDSIEMSSRGNSADFGDESGPYNSQKTGLSNQTRGVFGGGFASPNWSNVIDYVTIATAGNATDFGNLSETKASMGSVSSSTRGVFMGGRNPTNQDEIEYITIASTGDVTDFGDLVDVKSTGAGASSGVRGLHGGGLNPGDSAGINVIEFITIASTGNGTDFGDLTRSNYLVSATTNSTRAVFGGGLTGNTNVMDFVTIATTGNATDYGDLITASSGRANGSNADSHGGLQG